MNTIEIIINGVSRTYKGTQDDMMAKDWNETLQDHLTDNGTHGE